MIELARLALVLYGTALLARHPGTGARFLLTLVAVEFVGPRLLL